jgi:hypothetical protein
MSKERIAGEPDDRQEQKQEEPFVDLKRLDARVQRFVDDAKELNLRERLIREAAKSSAFVAAAFGALAFTVFGLMESGTPMSRQDSEMIQFACMAAVILGFIAAICCGKTARIWRAYRGVRSSKQQQADNNSRADITDIKDA